MMENHKVQDKAFNYKMQQSATDQDAAKDIVQQLCSFFSSLLDGFLEATSSGMKILDKIDCMLKKVGIYQLGEKIARMLSELGQLLKNVKGNMAKEKMTNNVGIQSVIETVAVFIHLQLALVNKASTSLSHLLDSNFMGQKLGDYVQFVNSKLNDSSEKNTESKCNDSSFNKAIMLPENAGIISQQMATINALNNPGLAPGTKETEQSRQQQCSFYTENMHRSLQNNKNDTSLVSDKEMDDVIALLSGTHTATATPPPPTLPKPASNTNPIADTATESNMYPLNCTQLGSPQISAKALDVHLGVGKPSPQLYPANTLQFNPYPNYNQFALPAEVVKSLQSPPMHLVTHQGNAPPIVKTNTWPMRPGKDLDVPVTEIISPDDPKLENELEFQQFVNSVKQRSRRGHLNNPWSEEGTTWSPLIYDTSRPDTRQWSNAEDSSNCSDESSTTGDWKPTKPIDLDTTLEAKSTGTWPPKHPWGAVGWPTERFPTSNQASTLPTLYSPEHIPPQLNNTYKQWNRY